MLAPSAPRTAWLGGSMGAAIESGIPLVYAIAHEVGNHLGAIRLQAHLLDDELDARALAEASILIDGLAGRSGPLLALLRPLLTEDWRRVGGGRWDAVLGRVVQQLAAEGTRGVRLEIDGDLDTPTPPPDFDWLQTLLLALVGATLEPLASRGASASVQLVLTVAAREVRLDVLDDGAEEDLSTSAALRGRPLAVAIARTLVGRSGGRVETESRAGRTRVGLVFPSA